MAFDSHILRAACSINRFALIQFVPDMAKRKLQQSLNEAVSPARSTDFTSLISKYSYSTAALDELDTKPLSLAPLTPPRTPSAKRLKSKTPRVSPRPKNPGYAPPSAYAHLPTPDLDRLAENLILIFIGLNPGIRKWTRS